MFAVALPAFSAQGWKFLHARKLFRDVGRICAIVLARNQFDRRLLFLDGGRRAAVCLQPRAPPCQFSSKLESAGKPA
jgi:hypothetical protein